MQGSFECVWCTDTIDGTWCVSHTSLPRTPLGVCRALLNMCGEQVHMGGTQCVSQTAVCRALLNECRALLNVC